MEIIKQEFADARNIASLLKEGKIIVYPTETCYGLGCDASNQKAVDKVFEIKQRQKDKPLLVVASDPATMMKYVEWNAKLEEFSNRYWPGPLTVVVRALPECVLANGVVAEDNTVAFRITGHHLASEISRELGRPLVSTSANITSHESPYDIKTVIDMFESAEHRPDIVIDAGALPYHSPSTIVRIENGKLEVIRQGAVVVEL